MAKVETVEEFLARGGKVTRVEYKEPPEESLIVKHKPQFTTDLVSLGEAEFYFGEHRGKPKVPKNLEKFNEALVAAALPENLVEIINPTGEPNDTEE